MSYQLLGEKILLLGGRHDLVQGSLGIQLMFRELINWLHCAVADDVESGLEIAWSKVMAISTVSGEWLNNSQPKASDNFPS
ncbi:hypothetical protein J6590_040594 [Homalodisca vitripennis]|nr:hypothetical protein J6590_040594 [Homalodisca vitripennis]